MEEAALTFAFAMLVIFGIIVRFVLPITLIIIGAQQTRKNRTGGKILFIVGIIYLVISVACYIRSIIMHGA